MEEIKGRYNDKRKSELALNVNLNITNEDLIEKEDVIITVTKLGYVKRMKQSEYRAQNRGGVGVSGMKTHKDDDIAFAIPVFTHDQLLFFTNKGRVYISKGYNIPEGNRLSKGIPLINIIPFQEGEKLQALTTIPQFKTEEEYESKFLFFVTRNGTVKRTSLSQFKNIRSSGIIAITLDEDDELYRVELTDGNREIVLAASNGKAIHFNENDVRAIGRNGAGVRGMLIGPKDKIIGVAIVTEEKPYVLVLSSNGYGKKTDVNEYRLQGRGGSGVKAMNTTAKTGDLVALDAVSDNDDILITTRQGIVVRTHVDGISQTSRATQGVKIITLKDNTEIASIAVVDKEEDEEEVKVEGVETENTEATTEAPAAESENTTTEE